MRYKWIDTVIVAVAVVMDFDERKKFDGNLTLVFPITIVIELEHHITMSYARSCSTS